MGRGWPQVLCFSDLFLSRVTVLSNKVAGVSGQFYIIYRLLHSACFHDFADVGKIVLNSASGRFAGIFGFFYYGFKVAPLSIAEVGCEFTTEPELNSIFVDVFDALEQNSLERNKYLLIPGRYPPASRCILAFTDRWKSES